MDATEQKDGRQPAPLFHKTVLCKFFKANRCSKGKACNFAHSANQLRSRPDFSCTKMCTDFLKSGSCKWGDDCSWAHDRSELRKMKRVQQDAASKPTKQNKAASNSTDGGKSHDKDGSGSGMTDDFDWSRQTTILPESADISRQTTVMSRQLSLASHTEATETAMLYAVARDAKMKHELPAITSRTGSSESHSKESKHLHSEMPCQESFQQSRHSPKQSPMRDLGGQSDQSVFAPLVACPSAEVQIKSPRDDGIDLTVSMKNSFLDFQESRCLTETRALCRTFSSGTLKLGSEV
eukprot:gb/GFBE01048786.1/.p1 GENE.gb/GFBE01048786.1/~~gb/GFBE01048786.1/.p1  ORF type:complete len:294 (+),score=57.58 gb/GFBE01048786.1/:1-882(+)